MRYLILLSNFVIALSLQAELVGSYTVGVSTNSVNIAPNGRGYLNFFTWETEFWAPMPLVGETITPYAQLNEYLGEITDGVDGSFNHYMFDDDMRTPNLVEFTFNNGTDDEFLLNVEKTDSLLGYFVESEILGYLSASTNGIDLQGNVINSHSITGLEFNSNGYYYKYEVQYSSAIPEPSTIAFLGLSTMGLYGYRRREKILGNFGATDIFNYRSESKRSLRWKNKRR